MYTGHFAVALAGAGTARRVPLPLFIAAAFSSDLVEGAVAALNVSDPTRVWSHSIPACAVAGAVLALAWAAAGGTWGECALLVCAALSHAALDAFTAVKSVWPGLRPVGLNLYTHPYVDAAIEVAFCIVGWLVWRAALERDSRRAPPVWAMLAVLLAAQVLALAHLLHGSLSDPAALSKFVR